MLLMMMPLHGMAFVTPELHAGLHGRQHHTSDDGLRASHNFSWSDTHGRQVNLSYHAEKHAAFQVFHLDDVQNLHQQVLEDTSLLLVFHSASSRDEFSTKLISGSVVGINGSMVRILSVRSQGTRTLNARVERIGFEKLFRNAHIVYSHKGLPEDFTRAQRPANESTVFEKSRPHSRRSRGLFDSHRRLDIFNDIGDWFSGVAQGIIQLGNEVANLVIILKRLAFDCAGGTCKDPLDPFKADVLDFNWDANTSGAECQFEMGVKQEDSETASATAKCNRCFAHAGATVHLELDIKDWVVQSFAVWVEGTLAYEFDVTSQGVSLDWDYKHFLGTIAPRKPPALSFNVFGVSFDLNLAIPMTLAITSGAKDKLEISLKNGASVDLKAGVRFTKAREHTASHGWELVNDASITMNEPRLSQISAGAEITLQLALLASLNLNFQFLCSAGGDCAGSIGGPVIPIRSYVGFDGGFDIPLPPTEKGSCDSDGMWMNIHAGIDAGIGAAIQLNLGDGDVLWPSEPYEMDPVGILAYKKPLYHGCISLNGMVESSKKHRIITSTNAMVGDVFEGQIGDGASSQCGFPPRLQVSLQMTDYEHCPPSECGSGPSSWLEYFEFIATFSGGNSDYQGKNPVYSSIHQERWQLRTHFSGPASITRSSAGVGYTKETTAGVDPLPTLYGNMVGGGGECSDDQDAVQITPTASEPPLACMFNLCKVMKNGPVGPPRRKLHSTDGSGPVTTGYLSGYPCAATSEDVSADPAPPPLPPTPPPGPPSAPPIPPYPPGTAPAPSPLPPGGGAAPPSIPELLEKFWWLVVVAVLILLYILVQIWRWCFCCESCFPKQAEHVKERWSKACEFYNLLWCCCCCGLCGIFATLEGLYKLIKCCFCSTREEREAPLMEQGEGSIGS